MKVVTDPEILQQLNLPSKEEIISKGAEVPESEYTPLMQMMEEKGQQGIDMTAVQQPKLTPVTDPDLLNQLEGGEQPEKGFLGRVGENLGRRGKQEWEMIKRKGWTGIPETAALTTANIAGAIGETGFEAIKSLYKTLTPDSVQKLVKSGVQEALGTKVGQVGLEAAQKGVSAWNEFKKAYPDAAEALGGLGDIAQFAFIKKGGKALKATAKEGLDITSDIGAATVLSKSPQYADDLLSNTVEKAMNRAIRPSTRRAGKTYTMYGKYHKNAKEGIERIIQNKQNFKLIDADGKIIEGALPETLSEFSQAIGQTKKALFKEYSGIAGEVGSKIVDTRNTAAALKRIARNKFLNDKHPELVKKINDLAETFKTRSTKNPYTVNEVQDAIQQLNSSLDAFYKNPSPETATMAGVDAVIADTMRDSLTKTINNSGYDQIKKAYGSLLAIEDDVAKRALADLRKNTTGLIDFTDIFSVYAGFRGVLRGDIATMGAAVAASTTKHFFKKWDDPNYIIKNMFNDAEKLYNLREFGRTPKSRLFNYFQENRNRDIINLDANGNEIPSDITDIVPRKTDVRK